MPDFKLANIEDAVFGQEIHWFYNTDLYDRAQELIRELAVVTGALFEWDAAKMEFAGAYAVGVRKDTNGNKAVAFFPENIILPSVSGGTE